MEQGTTATAPTAIKKKEEEERKPEPTEGHMQMQANKIIIQIFGMSHER